MPDEKEKLTPARVKANLQYAFDAKKDWINEAHDDYLFALGRQWDPKDVRALEEKGVLPLTINKVKPNIKLLTGIESQNRSDIMCYPEGSESGVKAEIATSLVKNVSKMSGLNWKRSEQFRAGIICGESYLEPYIDYTDDMINGDMKFKKLPYNCVLPEPGFEEYDLSDCAYVNKLTFNLTRDQVLSLFPDKEDYLDNIGAGMGLLTSPGMESMKNSLGIGIQKKDYNDPGVGTGVGANDGGVLADEPRYDLVEQYYKKYVRKYYAIRFVYGKDGQVSSADIKETDDKKEAATLVEQANMTAQEGRPLAKLIERVVPEIWRCAIIGTADSFIEEPMRAPTFPRWKGYPFLPYFADRYCLPMLPSDAHLLVQGIVRDMKDLNREYNKRRTQELRILNSSANSGFLYEKGAISAINKPNWEKFGASPGVLLEGEPGSVSGGKIEKIVPTQLSQGHSQLAAEHGADIKESSGINAEQLALETGEQSGRAIALRQKQGLVMVQTYFDNLSQTTRLIGKFILSHLGEIFDVGEAIHVLGQAFIVENFSEPVMAPVTGPDGQPVAGPDGKPVMAPQMDPMTGQIQSQVNEEKVMQTFNEVLTDSGLGKYEVAVGETISNETLKFANYTILMDMAEKGFPIPPEVLIDESMLSNASKEKIKRYIEQQQMATAQSSPKEKK